MPVREVGGYAGLDCSAIWRGPDGSTLGGGQALANREPVADEPLGLGAVAHRHHQVAEPFVGDRQVALEAGVGGVGGGQVLVNREPVAEEALGPEKTETWVHGPDGTRWEWYVKHADADQLENVAIGSHPGAGGSCCPS